MKIIILILFCLIGFLIGRFVVLNYTDNSLYGRINIKDVSLDKECESEICPLPEEYKDVGDR